MSEYPREKTTQALGPSVNFGICDFSCTVEARRGNRETVSLLINGSACKLIQWFSESVKEISLQGLFVFAPFGANPLYNSAQQARCHSCCPIPSADLKAPEVALSMALPRDVSIEFSS